MYEYILGVLTSYADGSLVQAEDPIRKEQAVALLSCRLERGGGIPVPMAWVPSVLGGMICSYSFTSVAFEPQWQNFFSLKSIRLLIPCDVICDSLPNSRQSPYHPVRTTITCNHSALSF